MERVIYKAQKPVQEAPAAASSKPTGSAGTQIGSVVPVTSTAAKPAQPGSRSSAATPSSNPPLAARDTKQRSKACDPELLETVISAKSPAASPAAAPATPKKREATAPMPIAAQPPARERPPTSQSPAHSPKQRPASTAQKTGSPTSTSNTRSRNSSRAGGGSSENSLSMPREQQNSDPVVGSWKWCAGCGSTGK